jgi:hypothetical protein
MMFAKVLRLRQMGVLSKVAWPAVEQWPAGILEFSRAKTEDNESRTRRLVLRNAQAAPDRGIIFELYKPELIDISEAYLRFRGVEAMTLGSDERAAMLQDWLVLVLTR